MQSLSLALLLLLLVCCVSVANHSESPQTYYAAAQQEQNPDSAIMLLEAALRAGLKDPMQVVTDRHFYRLIDAPLTRPQVRAILAQHASTHRARMTRLIEPGQQIVVRGTIVDEASDLPLTDVAVELVQADQDGIYFSEHSTWNPRIFAYLVTDTRGEFEVQTIRPGAYQDDDGDLVASHIHFQLKKPSYRPYHAEFTFDDDPRWAKKGDEMHVPVAQKTGSSGLPTYHVVLHMQPE